MENSEEKDMLNDEVKRLVYDEIMKGKVLITCVRNPFEPGNKEIKKTKWIEGKSARDYAQEFYPLASAEGFDIVASVNGQTIPEDEVASYYPSPGDNIVFCQAVHGGGSGGKQIGAMLAMVSLMAAAIITSPAWAAPLASGLGVSTTTATTIGMMGATMVGGILVNAIFQPGTWNKGDDSSPTYAWEAEPNLAKENISVPVAYTDENGIRVTPPIIGRYVRTGAGGR